MWSVAMSVQNLGARPPRHPSEFPTLYTAIGHQNTPDLHVIMNALGEEISVDQPANDGFFYKYEALGVGGASEQHKSYEVGLSRERARGLPGLAKTSGV